VGQVCCLRRIIPVLILEVLILAEFREKGEEDVQTLHD
jgi:hypothetical protein